MDPSTSSGRMFLKVISVFDITLKPNNFFIDEVVTSGKKMDVERWIPTNKRLIVSSSDEFVIGDRIIGESSGTEVVVEAANFNHNSFHSARNHIYQWIERLVLDS